MQTYKRPQEPDMREDGQPQVTILRARRPYIDAATTRLGRTTEEMLPPPPPMPRVLRPGLLGRAARAILRAVARRWLPLSFGVLLFISIYVGYQQYVQPTWNNVQAHWHTGDGRIKQFDADVGHGGVSHFLAQYYDGRIVVIEISLNNPSHIHTYSVQALSPNAKTQDLTIVVQDVNHDGRPDLVIQEGDNSMAIILYNTGTGFSTAEEHI